RLYRISRSSKVLSHSAGVRIHSPRCAAGGRSDRILAACHSIARLPPPGDRGRRRGGVPDLGRTGSAVPHLSPALVVSKRVPRTTQRFLHSGERDQIALGAMAAHSASGGPGAHPGRTVLESVADALADLAAI